MADRPTRALSIGWFGERNLGDEAMLEGLQAVLRRAFGEVRLTVTSADPAATSAAHGCGALPTPPVRLARLPPAALLRATWTADLVTLGGGDLLREKVRGLAPARYWLRQLDGARWLRRPSVILGVSVGELTSRAVLDDVVPRLRRVQLVAVRDEPSAARLEHLGLTRVRRMGDLALESPDLRPLPALPPLAGRRPRLGVVVRQLGDRGNDVAADAGARLTRTLADALDALVRDHAAVIELIPFRTRPRPELPDDDAAAGAALAAAATTGASWLQRERPASTGAFAAAAREVDAILSVRLHGLVLGAGLGRPIIGIGYDAKIAGFLEALGEPQLGLPLEAASGEIVAAVLAALEDRALPNRLVAATARLRASTAALVPELAAVVGREPASPGAEASNPSPSRG